MQHRGAARSADAWTQIVVAIVLAAVAVGLWASAATLVKHWRENATYGHGLLVVATVVVWVFRSVRGPFYPPAGSGVFFAAPLALLTFLWIVALRANLNIVHQMLLPMILLAAVATALGGYTARRLVVPVGFLYFAIPIWDYLLPALQRISVSATETILAATGLPAKINDSLVTIPEGIFEIAEGCSGLRYLIVALALAYAGAALNTLSARRALALASFATVAALAMNWLRIAVVIYAGHLTDMQHYFVSVEHESLGFVLFLPLLASIVLVARLLARTEPNDGMSVAKASDRVAANSGMSAVLICLAILAVPPLVARMGVVSTPPVIRLGPFPLAAGAWLGPYPPSAAWSPEYLGAVAASRVAYVDSPGTTAEVYVNLYSSQSQGRELVSYGNALLAPGDWTVSWSGNVRGLVVDGMPELASMEARTADGRAWLVAYLYKVGTFVTHFEGLAQAAYGFQSLFRPVPAGVIAVAVQCQPNCDGARRTLMNFWKNLGSGLLATIPASRESE